MHSIYTTYDNQVYRSRLEAEWACFYTILGVPFIYEKEKVDLGAFRYIPDYWLSEHLAWHEVKGDMVNDRVGMETIEKCSRLALATEYPVILTYKSPLHMRGAVFNTKGKMFSGAYFTACPECGYLSIAVRIEEKTHRLCPYILSHIPFVDTRMHTRLVFEAAKQCSNLNSHTK